MGKYHPNQEVSDAIEYAMDLGWTVIEGGRGHLYCMLRCPQGDRTGCQVPVFSTPKNPGNHARKIVRKIDKCTHRGDLTESSDSEELEEGTEE